MALDVEFGRVAVSGGTANAIIYIRWGFTEEGVPRLMQHAYTGLQVLILEFQLLFIMLCLQFR